ncbi:MAG: VCBS repeat-containing protein [Alphaproteobacteria bacterium]|nr:VCBS repeat-containing protein [Alphaproteobacteria bacterium]
MDNAGQLAYTIPIQTPPGTAGMAPHLSLSYSSSNGDGFEGYGWALGGLDAITRCASSAGIDGTANRGAVNYDSSDKFCLNGLHLMLQTGTYGADGSTYYGYITTFTKITYHSSGGATWFEAHLRNGIEEDFGSTTDSELDVSGTSTPREWHVNKVIDKKGNYLTVTYNNDATNGAVYPQRIDYTGNAGASLSTYNSVQFVYTTSVRADENPTYEAGYLKQVPYLLTDIKTYNGTSVVLDYKLAYRAGTSTTHSRLTSVTQCDGGTNCLAPTTFDWQGGTGLPSYSTVSPGITGPTLLAGDFTFDGLTDALMLGSCPSGGDVYAGTATGSVGFSSAGMTSQYKYWDSSPPHSEIDYSGTACFTGLTSPFVADFDGDGASDVVFNETYWHSGISTPVSTVLDSHPKGTGLTQLLPPPVTPTIPQLAAYADYNGDGFEDGWQQTSTTSGKPFFATYDGMFYAATFSVTGTGTSNTLIPGDFNGDGCDDVLTQGGASQAIYFMCSSVTSGAAGNYSGTVLTGDFNGDGKSDVLVVGSSNAKIYLSTGEGLPVTGLTVSSSSTWHNYQVVVGDWNGDGKSDVALIGQGTNHLIFLSTGTDFTQVASISNTISSVSGQVADWNSDGADDIWLRQSSGDQIVAFNFQPEFITAIHNGLGATTTATYKPLNTNGTFYAVDTVLTDVFQMEGGYYAVSRLTTDDGAGVTSYHTDYSYTGGMRDPTVTPIPRARGQWPADFTAFESITSVDSRAGNPTTTSSFITTGPLQGFMKSRQVAIGSVVVYRADYTTNYNVLLGANNVQIAEILVTRRDLNGTSLPTIKTDFPSYDSYGNPLTITTTNLSDSSTSTTTNTYTNDDSSNWILGQLKSTTVENVVGSSDITRHFNYTPDAATGYNTKTVLEQGNTPLELDTNYYFDTYGNVNKVQDSGTDITTRATQVAYDAAGEFPNTLTNALSQVTTYSFSAAFGGVTGVTDPNSVSTSTTYDTLGRVSNVAKADSTQIVIAYNYCSGVNGGSTSCPAHGAYAVTSTPESPNPSPVQAGAVQTTYYDSLGRVIAQDIQGFDGSNIRSEIVYNADGNVYKTSRPYFTSGGTAKYNVYTYDSLHRIKGTTYPDSSTDSYCYDGLTTSYTDRDSRKKVTVRNVQGQVSSVTEAASGDCNASGITGTSAGYTYDAFSDLLTMTDPGGNVTTYTYDVRGRRLTAKIPDRGGTAHPWSFNYYVDSTVKNQTDANGNSTSQTYDKLMRPLVRTESDFTTKLIWDQPGAVGPLRDACVNTTCLSGNYQTVPTYDSDVRLQNQKLKLDGTAYNYTYSYDPATGNMSSVVYPSGFQADYTYNTYGYLTQITDHGTGKRIWQANSADAELHLTQQTEGPSTAPIVETANYDANTGRLQALCASTNALPCDGNVLNLAYNWDALGNLNYRQDTFEGYTEQFCYDSLNRLTGSATGSTCISPPNAKALAYDSGGNITRKSDVCNTANCMTYGAGGNAGPHALSSITGTYNGVTNPTFTYDNNGNMLSGAGVTLGYMSFNQPSSISEGTNSVGLAYDSFHQRFKMCVPNCTSPTTTTNYLRDPMTGVYSEKVVSGSTTTWNDYVVAPGQGIVAVRIKTTGGAMFRYVGLDHLGSVTTLTDGTPSVVERNSYDPWGKRRNADGTDSSTCSITSQLSRGFTGHEMLDTFCLVNMNALISPQLYWNLKRGLPQN